METSSEDATITLKSDGNHSVKGNSTLKGKGTGKRGTTTVKIPVNGKKGDGKTKRPNLLPGKLDDISNRNK